MQRVAMAIAGLVLGVTAVEHSWAADLPRKAPIAVAPAPVVTWTQCYLGGNVGIGWADKDWSIYNPHADRYDSSGSHSSTGIAGGVQIGCDYQAGTWVFGVQGMYDWADISGSHTYQGFHADYKQNSRVSSFATLTGRVGYLIQPVTLLYFKGGAAWVWDDFSERACGYSYCSFRQADGNRSGWTVGGGVEYKINPSWSVFVEYNYMDFGTQTKGLVDSYDGFRYSRSISQDVQAVLFGVNWRWGGGTAGGWSW